MCTSFSVAIQSQLAFLSDIYKANHIENEDKQDLRKCVGLNLRIVKAISTLTIANALMLMLVPVLSYLLADRFETLLPLSIPFIRNDTIVGYTVLTIYQLVLILVGSCTTIAPDVFLVTMTMHYWPMTRFLDRTVRNLNVTSRDFRNGSICNTVANFRLKKTVRNLILLHQQIYQ